MKQTLLSLLTVIALCGCTHTWDHPPLKQNDPYRNISHRYYVIDINSDIPDAFFETYKEASIYQKDFAEYHEYVIVKSEEKYNVYNMEPKISLSEKKYKK